MNKKSNFINENFSYGTLNNEGSGHTLQNDLGRNLFNANTFEKILKIGNSKKGKHRQWEKQRITHLKNSYFIFQLRFLFCRKALFVNDFNSYISSTFTMNPC